MGLTSSFKSIMGDGAGLKVMSIKDDIRKLRDSFILLDSTLGMMNEIKKRKRAHGCIAKCDGILDRLTEILNELLAIDTN